MLFKSCEQQKNVQKWPTLTPLGGDQRPWVDFANILRKAFMRTNPKMAKDTDDLTEFLHI